MDDLLVRICQLACGSLDRVDVADEVGDGDVGGGELLPIARLARHPLYRRCVPEAGNELPALAAHRGKRIVVGVRACDDGDLLVEEAHEAAENPRFRLAAEAQEDEIVPGEQGVHQAGDDGGVVADDAGKQLLTGAEHADQIVAHLVLDGLRPVAGRFQLAQCFRRIH